MKKDEFYLHRELLRLENLRTAINERARRLEEWEKELVRREHCLGNVEKELVRRERQLSVMPLILTIALGTIFSVILWLL